MKTVSNVFQFIEDNDDNDDNLNKFLETHDRNKTKVDKYIVVVYKDPIYDFDIETNEYGKISQITIYTTDKVLEYDYITKTYTPLDITEEMQKRLEKASKPSGTSISVGGQALRVIGHNESFINNGKKGFNTLMFVRDNDIISINNVHRSIITSIKIVPSNSENVAVYVSDMTGLLMKYIVSTGISYGEQSYDHLVNQFANLDNNSSSLDRSNYIKDFEDYFIRRFAKLSILREYTDHTDDLLSWMYLAILTRTIMIKIINHYFEVYNYLGEIMASKYTDKSIFSDRDFVPTSTIGRTLANSIKHTTATFINTLARLPHYEIEYGYLSYKDKAAHILSFILDHNNKTIEINDTGIILPVYYDNIAGFIKYKYPYTRNYNIVIFNNSNISLQSISKEYRDIYCMVWSSLFLYRRLIQGLSVEEMRKVYLYDNKSDIEGEGGLGVYTNVTTFYNNFVNEIKRFILATINQYYEYKYPNVNILKNHDVFKEKYSMLLLFTNDKMPSKAEINNLKAVINDVSTSTSDNLDSFRHYVNNRDKYHREPILDDTLSQYPNRKDYIQHIKKKIAYYGGKRRSRGRKRSLNRHKRFH